MQMPKSTQIKIKECSCPLRKEAQQTTAGIVHAALLYLYERKMVYLILVNFTNISSKLAARNHISGTLSSK